MLCVIHYETTSLPGWYCNGTVPMATAAKGGTHEIQVFITVCDKRSGGRERRKDGKEGIRACVRVRACVWL